MPDIQIEMIGRASQFGRTRNHVYIFRISFPAPKHAPELDFARPRAPITMGIEAARRIRSPNPKYSLSAKILYRKSARQPLARDAGYVAKAHAGSKFLAQ